MTLINCPAGSRWNTWQNTAESSAFPAPATLPRRRANQTYEKVYTMSAKTISTRSQTSTTKSLTFNEFVFLTCINQPMGRHKSDTTPMRTAPNGTCHKQGPTSSLSASCCCAKRRLLNDQIHSTEARYNKLPPVPEVKKVQARLTS